MSKQSILIVHNYYQIPGGEDTVVANEKKMLEDNGHKVVLYTRNNNEIKTMNVFRKILLPFTSIYSFKTAREIKRVIKEENIDIVHVHNTLSLISPSVYYAAVKMNKPVVQTIHNFRMLCPGATFYRDGHICEDCVSKGLRCSLKYKCYRNSFIQTLVCVISAKIHRTTGIYSKINYICLTEFNKNKLLQLKQIKPERVFVKPNFSPLTNVCNNINQNNIDDSKDYFLFVGRLEKIKGIDFLVSAWKKQKNLDKELIICGEGPLENEIRKYINENNISNIKLMGYTNHSKVMELMKKAKALLFTSVVYEAFPMTIIEAFSQGLPVISSDIGNGAQLIEDGKTGIKYKYGNKESLLEAINKISKLNLKENVIREYKNKYTDEKNYELLFKIYNDIYMGKENEQNI